MAEERPDPTIRLLGVVAGATLLWFVSLTVASLTLNSEPQSAVLRAAMVALAVVGFVAWICATALSIRAQDEYTERIHLVALACAFAVTGVFVFAADFLQRAGFLSYLSFTTIWLVMVGTWWLSMVIVARIYR
jgi:hypothetical protein